MKIFLLTLITADAARNITAGGLTGMIFKSTRGTKPMLISGGIVASAAALWTVSAITPFFLIEADLFMQFGRDYVL